MVLDDLNATYKMGVDRVTQYEYRYICLMKFLNLRRRHVCKPRNVRNKYKTTECKMEKKNR